jgi:CMP-N-acetylneuraminic acid synthetase
MINGHKVLAVIPARGGSKRAPRKNIREFRGKPLFQWAYEAAKPSQYIDSIWLSSEDTQILQKASGLCIPILARPDHLATDDASNEDVMRHVLSVFPDFDLVVLLQPTSPLRTTGDIDACISIAHGEDDGCISFDADGKKNGAVYVCWVAWLERGYNFSRPVRGFYIMPNERSLDIDYPEQFDD